MGLAGRGARLLLLALPLANFALRVALQVRPLEFLDDLAIPDDAYLSLTIARNTRPATVTRVGRIGEFETWGAKWYLYRLESP